MDAESFGFVCGRVGPLIEKEDTFIRKSISADERLSICLRFLATGEYLRSNHLNFYKS